VLCVLAAAFLVLLAAAAGARVVAPDLRLLARHRRGHGAEMGVEMGDAPIVFGTLIG